MSKVKINIVDQDGNNHNLEKDLLFGCAMDSAGEGNCQCMSFHEILGGKDNGGN